MIVKEHISNGTVGRAFFSDDENYRYVLEREWDDGPFINFIMLNPSIGDHEKLENTTKGVFKRAQNWGYGGMMIVNLFGLIATDPKQLTKSADPVGPSNDWAIDYMLKFAQKNEEPIVCAWGAHGTLKGRDQKVLELLEDYPLHVLMLNQNGTPRHPLHMAHSKEPEIWKK